MPSQTQQTFRDSQKAVALPCHLARQGHTRLPFYLRLRNDVDVLVHLVPVEDVGTVAGAQRVNLRVLHDQLPVLRPPIAFPRAFRLARRSASAASLLPLFTMIASPHPSAVNALIRGFQHRWLDSFKPLPQGNGKRIHKGMWSLTLCSNLAKKSDLSLPARLSTGFPSNASLNSLTNSKTP